MVQSASRWGKETWGAVLHTHRDSRSEISLEEKGEWGKSELRETDMKGPLNSLPIKALLFQLRKKQVVGAVPKASLMPKEMTSVALPLPVDTVMPHVWKSGFKYFKLSIWSFHTEMTALVQIESH